MIPEAPAIKMNGAIIIDKVIKEKNKKYGEFHIEFKSIKYLFRWFDAEKADTFKPGEAVNVTYTQSTYQGNTYRNITSMEKYIAGTPISEDIILDTPKNKPYNTGYNKKSDEPNIYIIRQSSLKCAVDCYTNGSIDRNEILSMSDKFVNWVLTGEDKK